MKTTLIILLFAAMFCQAGCSQSNSQQNKTPAPANWSSEKLEGKVKSQKVTYYGIKETTENCSDADTSILIDNEMKDCFIRDKVEKYYDENGYLMIMKATTHNYIAQNYTAKYNKGIIKEAHYLLQDYNIKETYKNGHIVEDIKQDSSSNYFIKRTHNWDKYNNIISVSVYDKTGKMIGTEITYENTYDNNLNLTEVIETNYDYENNNKIESIYKHTLVYDSNHNLMEQKCYKYITETKGYIIDRYIKFNKKKEILEDVSYEDGKEHYKDIYEYDDKGSKTSYMRYRYGLLSYELKCTKTLNNNEGKIIEVEGTVNDKEDKISKYIFIEKLKYDNSGNNVEYKRYDIVNDKIQLTDITTTEYEYYE